MELITQTIEQAEENRFQGHPERRLLTSRPQTPQHGQGQQTINDQMTDLINPRKRGKIEGITRLMREEKNNPHHHQHGGQTQEEGQEKGHLDPSDRWHDRILLILFYMNHAQLFRCEFLFSPFH